MVKWPKMFPKGSEADNALAKHRATVSPSAPVTVEYARYYGNVPAEGEKAS